MRADLFLVDRGNLGRQAKKEFDAYVSPYNNFKFGEEYIVQHLTNNKVERQNNEQHVTNDTAECQNRERHLPSDSD